MTIEEVHNHIVSLTWDEIRELRNFCDRTMRVKWKEIRRKKIMEKSLQDNKGNADSGRSL